jgi:hypothetical protein
MADAELHMMPMLISVVLRQTRPDGDIRRWIVSIKVPCLKVFESWKTSILVRAAILRHCEEAKDRGIEEKGRSTSVFRMKL